jgi:predicted DNA-binding transcriptional regulator AlpA
MSKVLTTKEVGAILRIGKNKAYTLMNSSAFPSYKLCGRLYVTEEALNNWLKKIENKKIYM